MSQPSIQVIDNIEATMEKWLQESAPKKKELEVFAKACKGKTPEQLQNIFSLACAAPKNMPKQLVYRVMWDFLHILSAGTKVNGEPNNWNNGGFGSRWLDMDETKYGLDGIRCAFYSKKFYPEEWKHEKPIHVQIIME